MVDQQEGWICGNAGIVLHTMDAGQNWTAMILGGDDLNGISFRDASSGIIVGDKGKIFYTHDGGNSGAETGIKGGFDRKVSIN